MTTLPRCTGALAALVALSACAPPASVEASRATDDLGDAATQALALEIVGHRDGRIRFVDFGHMLEPSDYDGRVFRLSQDYPRTMPARDAAIERILAIDFEADWREYLMAVRSYVFEGNATTDYANSFYLEDNTVRRWYHVPWQHWGELGREGIHGLTREGPIASQVLAPEQTQSSFAYAVGFYNDLGGWTIGQAWPDATAPDLTYFASGGGFPVGTVVAKVLFTALDGKQVPYLVNPVTWQAYVEKRDVPGAAPGDGEPATARAIAPMHLIQMDIMVRDDRAIDTGGWVFGNFAYNGELGNENRWENLIPVGIQWGNDPTVRDSYVNETPGQPSKRQPDGGTWINPDLEQTIINPDRNELPPMHLGWSGRLNGPADNPASSCMSCHSTAQYPARSAIMPQFNDPAVPVPPNGTDADDAWMRWFRNVPCATTFDPGTITLDYSLQLVKSIENYIDWRDGVEQGHFALEYEGDGHPIRRNIVED